MPILAKNIVSTSQPLASQAGLRMLLKGGNAIDAAIACAIALTVVEPTMNGLGSDAFAIIWDGKELKGLNASGRSPEAWTPEYFSKYKKMPRVGWDTVTIPGAVSAWAELSKQFGRLPFQELFKPAIDYAKNGFLVSPITAQAWGFAKTIFRKFSNFVDCFLPNGKAPKAGSVFSNPDQVRSLELISETKGDAFYKGELAEKIVEYAKESGGLITLEDLKNHQADWVKPLSINYKDITLHEIPPNGQGIAALIALGILKHWNLNDYKVDSADSLHIQIEAMKLAFADVYRYISDPSTMEFDYSNLLDPEYLAERAKLIELKKAKDFKYGVPKLGDTVYLTTADADGMMVSYIQSNYMFFGSGIVVPGTGISFQNRGMGFTLEEGHPNQVGPNKRPFHTIIPAFITRNNKPLMSFGVMGGPYQPQGHVNVICRIFDYNQNPQAASDAPRWQVLGGFNVGVEEGFKPEVLKELTQRGHNIMKQSSMIFGGAQIIYRLKDGYTAASDHRKDGQAVGF
ncbi:MAG: gamma-glutamyltransferase [Candidatus Helarchaeota archaeon]|nr:gamma-glutamyltransferase [Candidatus Helarchaeota archaeon]